MKVLVMTAKLNLLLSLLTLVNVTRGKTMDILLITHYSNETDLSSAAVDIAFEDFMKKPNNLKNSSFNFHLGRSNCDGKTGMKSLLSLVESGTKPTVVIGPYCSQVCEAVSFYLSFYDTAMFSPSCIDEGLQDKTTYDMVIRLGAGYDKMAKGLVTLFRHYNWSQVAILYTDRPRSICRFGANAIVRQFNIDNINVVDWIRTPRVITNEEFDMYLDRIEERARIVLLCLDYDIMNGFLARAYERGFESEEYVFIHYAMVPSLSYNHEPWQPIGSIDKRAFHMFKQFTMAWGDDEKIDAFLNKVAKRMLEAPWYGSEEEFNKTKGKAKHGSLFLYEATWLYLTIINDSLANGIEEESGRSIMQKSKYQEFQGPTGTVRMDGEADRQPDFWFWFAGPKEEEMTPFLEISYSKYQTVSVKQLTVPYWGDYTHQAPPDVPACGFHGQLCPPEKSSSLPVIVGVSVSCVIVVLFLGIIYFKIQRKRLLEESINRMLWLVKYEDLKFMNNGTSMTGTSFSSFTTTSVHSHSFHDAHHVTSDDVASYQGKLVVVHHMEAAAPPSLSHDDLKEINAVREMRHDNLATFIGACLDPPHMSILVQYCEKGNLQDIIENDLIKLDWLFQVSLLNDLLNGLRYLHKSVLKSHGHLDSSVCLVDNRWMLKITDYGLHPLTGHAETRDLEGQAKTRLLWRAPELLRSSKEDMPKYGTKKGDIYSFGVVMHEILFRSMPFMQENISTDEMFAKLMQGGYKPVVPLKPTDSDDKEVVEMIKLCWAENPDNRPSLELMKKVIDKARKDLGCTSILDAMLVKLERYASNLEDIVAKRTADLVAEKRKTDLLLYRMLPRSIAEELKKGNTVKPELYDQVTIYFSDIVGFTNLASQSEPIQVVDLLNDLYTLCDDVIAGHDVYKVETIGDAYMCVSGLPNRNDCRHVSEIANMALDLLKAVSSRFRVRHRPDTQLRLRIGVHTGPCAAGIVGLTMPRYCLFGDTVNMASRMESTGEALKIHLSNACKLALERFGGYETEVRGTIEVKGKGTQTTHWLIGKEEAMEVSQ